MRDLNVLASSVLHSQVRVSVAKTGGSGTVIYAKQDGNTYDTYVLTCQHVISDALTVRKEWDSRVGRERKKEYRQLVTVEFFDWDNVPHGSRPLNYSADAQIVAYDAPHDMAILKLKTVKQAPAVARIMKSDDAKNLRIGSPVVAVGAALLHDPVLTEGIITHMGDEIDYKDYWMSNAQIIFGNSGGAVFTEMKDGYEFIGIPSRVSVTWGTPITHLGYFSPVTRVNEFLEEQLYCFLVPGHEHNAAKCLSERLKRDKQEVLREKEVEQEIVLDYPEE